MNNIKLSFEDYYRENKGIKFTIILGSGFHSKNCKKTILNSWELLLKKISPDFISQGNYLLDFEQIILNESTSIQALKVEKLKLSQLANFIKNDQTNLNFLNQYPVDIFNPEFVSDIIVLNFDEVAEMICKKIHNCKFNRVKYVKIDKKSGKEAKIHQTTRYTEAVFPNNKIIRFWHPHGSISKASGMILSASSYSSHIANIQRLRRYSKNTKIKTKQSTWYDQLTHQPVLILGASISHSEWDIWSAITYRERNFIKIENKIARKPIFQMKSIEDSCHEAQPSKQWFEPLFDEQHSFENQWLMLTKLFAE